MKPLTIIETPFPEKFGVPRQSLLVPTLSKMSFTKNDFYLEAFRGIESFSHLWLVFEFHLIPEEFSKGLVRPPRFGGKKKLGVYATRSPHRPNRIGLSVVMFHKLELTQNEIHLWVVGADLVNGTPILDIKPYIPYTDSIPDAVAPLFDERPEIYPVIWRAETHDLSHEDKKLIEQVIALDPRPAQDKLEVAEYGLSFGGKNIRFTKTEEAFVILSVVTV